MNKNFIKEKLVPLIVENSDLKKTIKKISLFGSYLHGCHRPESDVDLLIEFFPSVKMGFFGFFDIKNTMEQTIGKNIDLLTPDGLSQYFRKEVLSEAEVIYEG